MPDCTYCRGEGWIDDPTAPAGDPASMLPCPQCAQKWERVDAHCVRCDRPVQCLPGAEDTVLCFPCTTTPPDRYAESTAEYARRMMGLAAVHDDTE